jgi:hypothetical protein
VGVPLVAEATVAVKVTGLPAFTLVFELASVAVLPALETVSVPLIGLTL